MPRLRGLPGSSLSEPEDTPLLSVSRGAREPTSSHCVFIFWTPGATSQPMPCRSETCVKIEEVLVLRFFLFLFYIFFFLKLSSVFSMGSRNQAPITLTDFSGSFSGMKALTLPHPEGQGVF